MKDLRPIGTEFEIDLGIDLYSTDPRGRKVKYRVIDHKSVMQFEGDVKGEIREMIECISIKYYDIDYFNYNRSFTY